MQILSPPHVLLFVGLRMITGGLLVLLASAMNRAAAERERGETNFHSLQRLFLFMGGLIVTGHMLLLTTATERPMLHTANCYRDVAIGVLFMLPLLWQASRHRWAASIAVGVYTVLRIAEVLVFPLFPATPRLGPVLNPVTHLVPAQFPILLIVPAVSLDLLWQRTPRVKLWLLALASGLVFTITMVATEWPFADFLMTKSSENRLFDTMDFDFAARSSDRVHQFSFVQSGWPLWHGLLITMVCASTMSWAGLYAGRWLRSVQR